MAWGGRGFCRPWAANEPHFYRSRWHSCGNNFLLSREWSTAGRCRSSCCLHGQTWCLRNRRLHNIPTHAWKAPTSTFHQNLLLPGLLQPVLRSKGRKCARLSAPSLWATVLVSFKGPMYGKPQPVPFTKLLFCQEWLHEFRDARVQSVLDYPPPHFGPLFWFLSKDPCMESPNQYLSPDSSLPGMVASVLRSKGRKCARLPAP